VFGCAIGVVWSRFEWWNGWLGGRARQVTDAGDDRPNTGQADRSIGLSFDQPIRSKPYRISHIPSQGSIDGWLAGWLLGGTGTTTSDDGGR
jgi:hypothetical protein